MKRHGLLVRLSSLRIRGGWAYLLAACLALVAITLRLPFLDAGFVAAPYLTCFPVIILATFFGGVGAGALTTLLSSVGIWYFFLSPLSTLGRPPLIEVWEIFGFLLVAVFNILFVHWLTQALERNSVLANERELLLRELQHRVKNNFQTIQSFLYLQMRQSGHPEVKSVLSEANARLTIFVQAHDNLYEVGGKIDLREHLTRLCAYLEIGAHYKIVYEGESALWDVDRIIPVTMIVNEMIMNGVRHGRGDAATPIIIRFRHLKNGEVELGISARGRFPDGFLPRSGNGLGMRIVEGFAGQLRGRLDIERGADQDFLILRFADLGKVR